MLGSQGAGGFVNLPTGLVLTLKISLPLLLSHVLGDLNKRARLEPWSELADGPGCLGSGQWGLGHTWRKGR